MSETKHTPGPWLLDPCGDILGNKNAINDNGLVCTMCCDRNDEEGAANARLIAKSPILLEWLKAIVDQAHAQFKCGDNYATISKVMIGDIEKIIAEAEGTPNA